MVRSRRDAQAGAAARDRAMDVQREQEKRPFETWFLYPGDYLDYRGDSDGATVTVEKVTAQNITVYDIDGHQFRNGLSGTCEETGEQFLCDAHRIENMPLECPVCGARVDSDSDGDCSEGGDGDCSEGGDGDCSEGGEQSTFAAFTGGNGDCSDSEGGEGELMTDGGQVIESGDIVRHAGETWRVARSSDAHVEIYQRGGGSCVVSRGDVDTVPCPTSDDEAGDDDRRVMTDGGRPRKVVVRCDYCTGGMSVKTDKQKPDHGWKCKQCWKAENAGAAAEKACAIIDNVDVEPGDRVRYNGQEWTFDSYFAFHQVYIVPVGLVPRSSTVSVVDVRELDPVRDDSYDPYDEYDPDVHGRDSHTPADDDDPTVVTDGGQDVDVDGEVPEFGGEVPDVDESVFDDVELSDMFEDIVCPECEAAFDSERGMKSHLSTVHPDFEYTGSDAGSESESDSTTSSESDSDSASDGESDGNILTADMLEDATESPSAREHAEKREIEHKSRARFWQDARDAYAKASISAHEVTRRDALGVSLKALEKEARWMSVRERSEDGHQDLQRWVPGEGWDENGHAYVARRMDEELGTDADRRTVKKAVHHLAVRNKVDQNTLNAAEFDATLIPVANGVINVDGIEYDAETMTIDWSSVELQDMKPEHRFTFCIDTEWDPSGADLEGLDAWVAKITDNEDDVRTVWEFAGHSLHPRYPTDGFSVFVGEGGSGKSMLLKVIKKMLGDEDVTTLSISKIEQQRFAATHVADARANINTELNGTKIQSIDTLKVLSAGEELFVESKGEPGYFTRNDATMIFASDNPPALPNRNDALKRRLYPVEFPGKFVNSPDPNNPYEYQRRPKETVESELQADARLKAALMRAVEGLARLQAEGDFTTSMGREERLQRYESFADPARHFAFHCLEDAGPDSQIESGVFQETLDNFCAAQEHSGKALKQLTNVLDDMPSLSYAKDRSRGWSDEQSKHTVYSGLKFSAEALREFVPDHAKEDGKLDLSAAHEAEDDTRPTAIDEHDDDSDSDREDLEDCLKTVIDDMEDGDGAPREDVREEVLDRAGADREELDHAVERLEQRGEIYEPRTGHWRCT